MLYVDTVFKEKGLFVLGKREDETVSFVSAKYVPDLASQSLLCFGSQKLAECPVSGFLIDLDPIYRLYGKRHDDLLSLSQEVLGKDVCDRYIFLSNKIKNILKSYGVCDIDAQKYSSSFLLSKQLLIDFYGERKKICFLLYDKIENERDILEYYKNRFFSIYSNTLLINKNKIRIDTSFLNNFDNSHATAIKSSIGKNDTIKLKIKPMGAKTGRASFEKGSVNIYSLPKEMRCVIKARNGYKIVQFDYKNFQPRIAIALTNNDDFKNRFLTSEDFYSEFGGDRKKVKLSFLAWLFSDRYSDIFDEQASPIREHKLLLYNRFLDEGKLKNIFGRPLFFRDKSMPHLIYQNYITSTEADMVLEIASVLAKKLENNKDIRFLFPFHDAFIFEIKKEKINHIHSLSKIISSYHQNIFNTTFPVEIKVGKNFGEMEERAH